MTLLFFIGATGKSAQIPALRLAARRHGGPDAGLGPHPRRDDGDGGRVHDWAQRRAVRLAPQTMQVVAVIGALTALMAGTIGLVQNDIKRVLAYSTVSQLGYMFLAMGVGAFSAGIFHLYTHAFFKALMFLGSRRGHPRAARRAGHAPAWAA